MKRMLCLLTIFCLTLTFAACGADADADAGTQVDIESTAPSIDSSVSDSEVTASNNSASDFTLPAIQIDEPTLASTAPTSADTGSSGFSFVVPQITLPELSPVTMQPHEFEFDFDFNDLIIDMETFNVEKFKADTIDNVAEEDVQILENMEPEEIMEVAQIKLNLLDDLAHAFEEAGLSVQVNKDTGEITMDASVLFGVDEATVSEEGKLLLRQFMQIYSYVVFNECYDGFVSAIVIEGHTDTSADYDYNLKLSQERADQVKAFCLSEECGLDAAHLNALSAMLSAVGYSYDKPIYTAGGEVDMAASRRVTFRFLINLAQ